MFTIALAYAFALATLYASVALWAYVSPCRLPRA